MGNYLRYPGGDLDFLGEAAQWVKDHLEDGVICPCCFGTEKKRYRKLNRGMAYWLIRCVRRFNRTQDWVHIDAFLHERVARVSSLSKIGGDWAKLGNLWGLIVSKKNEDETKKCSGIWRPTQKGLDFAHGRITVPRRVLEYREVVYAVSEEQTTVQQALGDPFNYKELMEGRG